MSEQVEFNQPAAFLSYAHHDDAGGALGRLRSRLVDELQTITGKRFAIFKDDADIGLGERWQDRLDHELAAATFLLPVVTPSFLHSDYCRHELQAFAQCEAATGRDDLVLPLYYVDCSRFQDGSDAPAETLRALLAHQYFDWRSLRSLPPSNQRVKRALEQLASRIRDAVERVEPAPPPPTEPLPPQLNAALGSQWGWLRDFAVEVLERLSEGAGTSAAPAARDALAEWARPIGSPADRVGLVSSTWVDEDPETKILELLNDLGAYYEQKVADETRRLDEQETITHAQAEAFQRDIDQLEEIVKLSEQVLDDFEAMRETFRRNT